MKMGIKEFRERLGQVTSGKETISVTHHGRVVGHYVPVDGRTLEFAGLEAWVAARDKFRDRWKATNPDWRDQLMRMGWDDDGEPNENNPRR